MCTLSDFFSCIRSQGGSDKDYTSPTHRRHNLDDEYEEVGKDIRENKSLARDRRRRSGKEKQRSATLPSGISGLGSTSGFTSTCIRPLSRDLRISYEAMERYDEIFGGPDIEAGETSTNRHIPDQF
ncbi:uncharacterized protein Dana_GF22108 [Drosophila ananassae]|uniref:Uncharacterized protein n=1 Tax=Drosophila ananassae TaxID=7217 RepID=B3MYC0_DROAN|nr:uncharacterized protein LOC6504776 [Drosophila ananassae]EDV32614.1 uncharacterized protein Dana_GF22108 [Drosophila ananassae]